MAAVFGFDCYSPKEIAERVEDTGVTKANLPLLSMAALGVLAGGFIGLGALYSIVVFSDPTLGFAMSRMLGGITFSLGLILVIVAGAELFTGNNLLVMGWVARRINTGKLLQNLLVSYTTNLFGAVGLALLVVLSGYANLAGGAVGKTAVGIAATKCMMPFTELFFRGVLCNVLVCLAVWLAMAGRNVADKILAVIFPISAFVACGFEHSVANMFFIPLGIFLRSSDPVASLEALTWFGFIRNLIPVTLGNLLGGAGMVGLVYCLIYRRGAVGRSPSKSLQPHLRTSRQSPEIHECKL